MPRTDPLLELMLPVEQLAEMADEAATLMARMRAQAAALRTVAPLLSDIYDFAWRANGLVDRYPGGDDGEDWSGFCAQIARDAGLSDLSKQVIELGLDLPIEEDRTAGRSPLVDRLVEQRRELLAERDDHFIERERLMVMNERLVRPTDALRRHLQVD